MPRYAYPTDINVDLIWDMKGAALASKLRGMGDVKLGPPFGSFWGLIGHGSQ